MLIRFIIVILLIVIGILWYLSYKRNNRQANGDEAYHNANFDPYEVLQVRRDATPGEIHKAWVELAAQYHPDKAAHLGPDLQLLAEKRFKEIQRAYDMLKQG